MKKLWIALLLLGCGSDGRSDRICPACEPELMGDTGDLGGTPTACWYYRASESVDVARAGELGFDVAALESALARRVDMPMEWRISSSASSGGGPARGYAPQTNVAVEVRSSRVYRHLRPDPAYCDGTTCRFPGSEEPVLQATCARSLETDVQVEVSTADDSVSGTLVGTAMQVRDGTVEGSGLAEWAGLVNAVAPLSEIRGRLRLDPEPGAMGYQAQLRLGLRATATATTGELSPRVFIKYSDATGKEYGPLFGVFPPVGALAQPQVDAGVRR